MTLQLIGAKLMRVAKRNRKVQSLDGLLRRLRAELKQIKLARDVLPDDIARDPEAVIRWIRDSRKRKRQRRKWPR